MRHRIVSKNIVLIMALSFLIVTGCLPSFAYADQSSASKEIASARSQLVECFNSAMAAEEAGSNISESITVLNNAGSLLSQAELAYSYGNFSGATTLAAQSQSELTNFVSTANSLQNAAVQRQNRNFFLSIIYPILGVMVVIAGSVVVWVLLKRNYLHGDVKQD